MTSRLGVAVIAFILAIIFVVENSQAVRIHFIVVTVSSRLWIGFLVCLVLGALLGQAPHRFKRRRR